MSSKHTPGPWSVKNDYDERHIVIANIDGESFPDGTTSYTYDFVCDTYGGDYESKSRAVANANARLIAAAPDLLEALKAYRAAEKAQSAYEARCSLPGVDDRDDGLDDLGSFAIELLATAREKLDAALAKAGVA